MSFELPKLEYDYNSLSPVISEETMRLHYGKHHQTYVDNLNKAVSSCEPAKDMSLIELASVNEQLNCSNYQAIINNAGGHYNHKLFWEIIGPANKNSGEPGGELAKMIVNKYGDFQQFVDQFTQSALERFGSGWIFLQPNGDIVSTANQNTPMMKGMSEPLLGLDVWEHAYYLDYKNVRADYINAWWDIVNWQAVENRFKNTTR